MVDDEMRFIVMGGHGAGKLEYYNNLAKILTDRLGVPVALERKANLIPLVLHDLPVEAEFSFTTDCGEGLPISKRPHGWYNHIGKKG